MPCGRIWFPPYLERRKTERVEDEEEEGRRRPLGQSQLAPQPTLCLLPTATLATPSGCSKCRFPGPASDPLSQNLHVDAVPR